MKNMMKTWLILLSISLCASAVLEVRGMDDQDDDDVAAESTCKKRRGCRKRCRPCRRYYNSCGTGPYNGLGGYEQCWYGPGWRPYYWGGSYGWGSGYPSYPYRGYYYAGPQFGVSFSV